MLTNNFAVSDGGILFCTDVCGMGVHIPGLVVGVSIGEFENLSNSTPSFVSELFLGICTTRWKNIQANGRLGRDPSTQAIFITLVEKKSSVRGLKRNFFSS